jgi:hypothetical protein
MAKRKESPAKRRKKMLALKPDQGPPFEKLYLVQRPGTFYAELSGAIRGKLQKSKEEFWVQSAKEALRLDGTNEADEELRSAFARHGLDPDDPRSWRRLLEIFCHVDFARNRKGGRKKDYTDSNLVLLWEELKERGLSKSTEATQEVAAKKLSKDKSSTFHGKGQTNLRVLIGLLRTAAKAGALEIE